MLFKHIEVPIISVIQLHEFLRFCIIKVDLHIHLFHVALWINGSKGACSGPSDGVHKCQKERSVDEGWWTTQEESVSPFKFEQLKHVTVIVPDVYIFSINFF